MRLFTSLLLLCHALGSLSMPHGAGDAPRIEIGHTTVLGRSIPTLQQEFFGGIPFAEPPIGHYRLQPPVLKTQLDAGVFNASDFGPVCLQPGLPLGLSSEDCLTINVLRPAGIPHGTHLPVMFWTYGGGFNNGGSAQFNGSAIVAQSVLRGTPIIYVNFNYRNGPLGFPQGQEAADEGALNLAIKDEIAALQWVQENIWAFGGDPHQVTVFGNSAGSIMTSILFLDPATEHLARAGIFQSGQAATSVHFEPAAREENWVSFVRAVTGCEHVADSGHTFDCLRQADEAAILQGIVTSIANAPEQFPFKPNLDGHGGVLPELPSEVFKKGHFAKLPFIAGTNLDEGTAFVPPTLVSEDEIRLFIVSNFTPPIWHIHSSVVEDSAEALLELYPDDPALGSPFCTGNETFGLSPQFKRAAAIQGDLSFTSQRRFWSQEAGKAGVSSWAYLFTEPQPQLPPFLGVTHATEVLSVYGAPDSPLETAQPLSNLIIDYWVSFATSLDPNDGKGLPRPKWEGFKPHNQVVLELNGQHLKMIPDHFRTHEIDFINSIPLVFYHK
ncbi:hypothetical protein AX16_007148 [Volvariella volvacea WC 439]|nr:hypothetical protein AX16_007148 [Volvariella volvacea WC 439]